MADNRIDGSAPREKLYESMDDDPAKIAEDKAKLEYAAKQTTTRASCEKDSSQIPCATTAKDRTAAGPTYTEIAKNMPATQPTPVAKADPNAPNHDGVLPNTTDAMRKGGEQDGPVGVIGYDGGSVYAGGTAYKKTIAGSGVTLQVLDVSDQVGVSNELQATLVRATYSDKRGSVVVEGPSAKFSQGFGRNDDGSTGFHAGGGVAAASAQVTGDFGDGSSGTIGVSEGVGLAGSIGGKTAPDGSPVVCVQVSALFFTAGACVKM